MRKLVFGLVLLLVVKLCAGQSQNPRIVDSVIQLLAKSSSQEDKFRNTAYLSRLMMTLDPVKADEYGKQLIEIAEVSRDKGRIIEAFLINGDRYSYLAGRKDNIVKSIDNYNKALELAKKNEMDTSIVRSLLALSVVNRYLPDFNRSLDYCNQANSYSTLIRNDSIRARVNLEYGTVYLGKDEKLLALRNYLNAIRIAEDIKSISLRRDGYSCLSGFYAAIGDNDKAIDMEVRSLQLLEAMRSQPGMIYKRIEELNRIGGLYSNAKNYDMAQYYFEEALKASDTANYEPIKPMTYRSIILNYLSAGQPQKALDYFNAHPQLKDFLSKIGFSNFIDQSYGIIYLRLGKYDSAKYYYSKVAPFFENDVNTSNQYSYYYQMGMLYRKTGETDKSLSYFLKAKEVADGIGSLEQMSDVVEKLDSLYQDKGDYRQAYAYASLNTKYKDSLNKLGKEKEMMQIEATDEQQRIEKQIKDEAEYKRRRNNIQYIGIIFGIVILFITLIVLGMFKVSTGLIKGIGFFVFLMLFEFIFLVFKKNIYSITHGEPWKDLSFMIGLAALLVPLHHWLEHSVLHYLTSHNRLTSAGHHIKKKLFGRSKEMEQ